MEKPNIKMFVKFFYILKVVQLSKGLHVENFFLSAS